MLTTMRQFWFSNCLHCRTFKTSAPGSDVRYVYSIICWPLSVLTWLMLDEHIKAFSNSFNPTPYSALPPDVRHQIELRLKRSAEFFASVVLTWVIRDLGLLLSKYVKKGEKWLAEWTISPCSLFWSAVLSVWISVLLLRHFAIYHIYLYELATPMHHLDVFSICPVTMMSIQSTYDPSPCTPKHAFDLHTRFLNGSRVQLDVMFWSPSRPSISIIIPPSSCSRYLSSCMLLGFGFVTFLQLVCLHHRMWPMPTRWTHTCNLDSLELTVLVSHNTHPCWLQCRALSLLRLCGHPSGVCKVEYTEY